MNARLAAAIAGAFAVAVAPAALADTLAQGAASATEIANGSYVASTGAIIAQNRGITGAGIRIGILDSGITDSNGEFTGRIVGQYDTNNGANVAADDIGHGTKVAGMAVAAGNGSGTTGIAPDAQVLAIRVYDANRNASDANILSGVQYALGNGARVLNMSFGNIGTRVAEQGLRAAVTGGALVVTAAGNYGGEAPIWPARFASQKWANGQVLAVGAVDANNNIADFSNRAGDAKNFYLVAPGAGVQTTCMSGYCAASGTSFAAPVVAGAAALIMSNWSYLTAKQTADILLKTATDLGAKGVDAVYGRGLLNLDRALQPVGVVKTYTKKGEARAVASAGIGGSAALNGTLQTAASQGKLRVAGFDDFGRNYEVDLGRGLRGNQVSFLEGLLAGADRALGVSEVALGKSASLVTYVDRPLMPANAIDPVMAAMDGQATRLQAMLLNIDAGAQRLSFGTGGLAQQFFGAAAGTDAGWLGQTIANPLFGMVGNHAHLGFASDLDAATTLRVGMVTGANPLAASGGLRVDPAQLWTAEVAKRWGDTRVAVSGSLLIETDGALGARNAGQHSTQSVQVGVSHRIADGVALAAQYTAAVTRADQNGGVVKLDNVVSQGWSAGLVAANVATRDDRLVLAVSSPLVATAGRIDVDASVGVQADGTPIQAVRQIDVGGARPLQTELRYMVRLADDRNLSAAVVHLDQGEQRDTAVTFKFTAKF